MRTSAKFPARETHLFKKQVINWAGKFFSCICFDFNGFRQFHPHRKFLAAIGEWETMSSGDDVFMSLKNFYTATQDWTFGYLSYDLRKQTEPKIFSTPDLRFDGLRFALAHFFHPHSIIEIADDNIYVHSTEDPAEIFQLICRDSFKTYPVLLNKPLQSRTSKQEYLDKVASIKQHIAQGDLYEMNLCQEFFAEDVRVHPVSLYHHLNDLSPAPFSCYLKHGDQHLLCSSPERFMMKEGNKITSQPMKGTIKRNNANHETDQQLIERLHNDPKERAENVMIVDLVRNDLARSSKPGTVKVDELFGIYTFTHVHQMISTISAELRNDVHFTDALRNAFPMGSMTGAPKVMAMQLIDQYESVKRGIYSGSVGYITPDGNFDFNVVIRSLMYNAQTNYLSFQAGSAITNDCVAEYEYQECLLKVRGLVAALSADTRSAIVESV